MKWLAVAVLMACVGCGRPSASDLRDKLGAMTSEESEATDRKTIIERIGAGEPTEIEDGIDGCETWVWKLSGGEVRLMVCQLDGKFLAQVREFGKAK